MGYQIEHFATDNDALDLRSDKLALQRLKEERIGKLKLTFAERQLKHRPPRRAQQ